MCAQYISMLLWIREASEKGIKEEKVSLRVRESQYLGLGFDFLLRSELEL